MMWDIKVKGKHLLLVVMGLLLLGVVGYLNLPNLLYWRAESLASQGRTGEAQIYYERVAEYFPKSQESAKALYFSAQNDAGHLTDGNGLVYIFSDSTGGASSAVENNPLKAIEKFKRVCADYPESPWAKHALRELGRVYYSLGEYDEAEKYLQESLAKSEMRAVESTELLGDLYLKRGEGEKALALANKSLEERPGFCPLNMMELKGRALLATEKYEEAQALFEMLPQKAESQFSDLAKEEDLETKNLNVEIWEKKAQGYLRKLEVMQKSEGRKAVIHGQVSLGGKAFSNVSVYLVDRRLHENYYTGSTRDLPRVITDEEGKFSFSDLVPGTYTVGLGVRPEEVKGYTIKLTREDIRVKAGEKKTFNLSFRPTIKLEQPLGDKITGNKYTFKWEKVEGAASYKLSVGPVTRDEKGNICSTYRSVLRTDIKENQLVIDFKKEREKTKFNGAISWDEGISPNSVLGYFYGKGEYTWEVTAYDSKGQELTSSNGFGFYLKNKELPLFSLETGSFSKADQLLMDRKYEEAIHAYEEILQENPRDAHSLLVLARLYDFGYKSWDDQDPVKAALYYEKLLEVEDTPQGRRTLAQTYYKLEKYQQALQLYKSLRGSSCEDWDIYSQTGKILVMLGKPQAGLRELERALKMENGQYIYSYPVALSLLLGDQGKALNLVEKVDGGISYLDLLQEYKQKGYRINPQVRSAFLRGEYSKALELLGDTDHDLFIEGLLKYTTENLDRREKVETVLNKMEPGLLKELLKMIVD